jgi:hypothetical protein
MDIESWVCGANSIRFNQDKLSYKDSDESRCWYPCYVASWSPAQIVSIYQTEESGAWMMQLRWFNRYRDLIVRQQKGLSSEFAQPHATRLDNNNQIVGQQ